MALVKGGSNQPIPLTEEEEWDLQMKRLEEIDQWTRSAENNIPPNLKDSLLGLLKKFPGLQRMPAYHLMSHYDWNEEKLSVLSDVLNKIPQDKILITIDFLLSLVEFNLHNLGLKIFKTLHSEFIVEWTSILSLEEAHYLIQVARHLPVVELDLMIFIIHELNIQEMIKMIKYIIDHPESRKCELCRQKRAYTLEYRMRTNQIPHNHLPTLGIANYLARNEQMWSPDDEKLFSFDTTKGQIFWNKDFTVNLVEICNKCLQEAHGAISNQGKYTSTYHLDAATRKRFMAEQREYEQGLATIIMQVAKERKYRRLKEFAIQAIELQRKGLKHEEYLRQQALNQQRQDEEIRKKKEERELLNQKAMAVDEKWKFSDENTHIELLQKRRTYTLLKYHTGYDDTQNLPPKIRKRNTWRLQDFDSAGLPLTAAAANQMFGISRDVEIDDTPAIDFWKIVAETQLSKIRELERLKRIKERERELEEFNTMKNYVRERIIMMERYHSLQKHISEEFEKNRLHERELAREERRRQRFLKYLEYERSLMEFEDVRSYELREYEFELTRELMERENMFNEELEQCEIDKFWGIDHYYKNFSHEEDRLNEFYIQRLKEKNTQLTLMRCIKKIPDRYYHSYLPKLTKTLQILNEADYHEPTPLVQSPIPSPTRLNPSLITPQESSVFTNSIPEPPVAPTVLQESTPLSQIPKKPSYQLMTPGVITPISSSPALGNSRRPSAATNASPVTHFPPILQKKDPSSTNLEKEVKFQLPSEKVSESPVPTMTNNNGGIQLENSLSTASQFSSSTGTADQMLLSKEKNNKLSSSAPVEDVKGIITRAREEIFEFQKKLNQMETEKRMSYVKHLKAEEIRMKVQTKIRPPLHEPKG